MGREAAAFRAPTAGKDLTPSLKFIGDRVLRKEDPRLLTGRGRYVGDLTLPGLVHAAILRSPHAHARIARIDVTRAREHSTVIDVVTFADLGTATRELPCIPLHPNLRAKNGHLLVRDRARFVGEAVAGVVADSRYAAEDARDLIEVEWEPLPVDAPVHDDIPDNLAGRVTLGRGDVERALRGAPRVASERIVVERGGGQPIEPRGLVADYNKTTGQLTVWASSQVPHQIRQVVSDILEIPAHRVRVLAPDVGGGFGAKLIVYPEDVLIPFLAMHLGRPVKWLEDRQEHMLAATQERTQVHDVTVAFDDDGRVLALRDRFVHDTGAYTPRGLAVPLISASMLPGPYRIPDIEVTMSSVYTNRVPVSPYRGAGQPQAIFVIERVLDLIARETGRGRTAVRLANLVTPGEMPYDTGLRNYRDSGNVMYDSGDFPAVLRRALEMARWDDLIARCERERNEGRLTGAGVAPYVEITGVGPFEGAAVRVEPGGRITVASGVPSQGQGLETSLAQICASELGVTPDDVTVVGGDTAGIAHGIGTFASRAAVTGGTAVALAARDVRAKALSLAAHMLGVPEDDVQQDGLVFVERARPDHRVTLAQLASTAAMATAAHAMPPGLESIRYFQPDDITYSSGAHVVWLTIDPVSATVSIRGYWVAHDSGRLINPMIVEGQIHGAVALGLGNALLEQMVYDDAGQPNATTWMDYLLPGACDVPPIHIDHLETLSTRNPLGFKGVGESGTLPVLAVVASAIDHALSGRDVRVTRMPMTPARLNDLLASAPGITESGRPPR